MKFLVGFPAQIFKKLCVLCNQRYALRCSSNWTVQCCNSVAMHFEQFLLACILVLCTLVCMAREWVTSLAIAKHGYNSFIYLDMFTRN